MISETTVKLSKPVNVAIKGANVECWEIHLTGPSWKNASDASALKAMWMEPFNKMIESIKPQDGDPPKEPTGKNEADKEPHEVFTYKEVVGTIAKYRDENTGPLEVMAKAFGYLESLLSHGCADFEGEPANSALLGRLSYVDQEKILGEFVKSFLLDSLFN